MEVCESSDRILRVSQIPHIKRRALAVIVGNQELSRDLGVPNDVSLSQNWLRGLLLTLRSLPITKIVRVIVLLRLVNGLGWLCEVEDSLAHLQVPDNNLAVLTGTGKDVGDNSIPTDRGDP